MSDYPVSTDLAQALIDVIAYCDPAQVVIDLTTAEPTLTTLTNTTTGSTK